MLPFVSGTMDGRLAFTGTTSANPTISTIMSSSAGTVSSSVVGTRGSSIEVDSIGGGGGGRELEGPMVEGKVPDFDGFGDAVLAEGCLGEIF